VIRRIGASRERPIDVRVIAATHRDRGWLGWGPMDHHPLHIYGHAFVLVGTDGGAIPPSSDDPSGPARWMRRTPADCCFRCYWNHLCSKPW
jgi:hypothetical protein